MVYSNPSTQVECDTTFALKQKTEVNSATLSIFNKQLTNPVQIAASKQNS